MFQTLQLTMPVRRVDPIAANVTDDPDHQTLERLPHQLRQHIMH
jgi:hypothetical protein